MGEKPWYQEVFGEQFLRVYRSRLTPERTSREVEGILRLLDLPPGSRILDLGCGYGRHAISLAEHGHCVTGLDLSEYLLERADAEARAQGVEIRWVHSDMRAIPFEDEFDCVINIFNTFGYLESDEEDRKVLQQVHQALKPGGRLLLELRNREHVIRHFQPSAIERQEDGLIVLNEYRFDLLTSRGEGRVTLMEPDGRRSEYCQSIRIYTLTELARMLEAAGLRPEACCGGLDGSQLTIDSPQLAILARKLAEP